MKDASRSSVFGIVGLDGGGHRSSGSSESMAEHENAQDIRDGESALSRRKTAHGRHAPGTRGARPWLLSRHSDHDQPNISKLVCELSDLESSVAH